MNKLKSDLMVAQQKLNEVELALKDYYIKTILEPCQYLKDCLLLLELSNNYSYNSFGEIDRWIRFSAKKVIDLDDSIQIDALNEFLEYVNFDLSHGVLTDSIGPSIIINQNGSVYDEDTRKFILNHDDYETSEDRNRLIEVHMEQEGHFPCVFLSDYYGNLTIINTNEVKSK